MNRYLKGLLLVSSFLAVPVFGASGKLNVDVKDEDGRIQVSFTAKETTTSICHLGVTRLEMRKAQTAQEPQDRIIIDTKVNPQGICLPSIGSNSGAISFDRGNALPSLAKGSHELVIDGDSYGTIIIDHYGAFLFKP